MLLDNSGPVFRRSERFTAAIKQYLILSLIRNAGSPFPQAPPPPACRARANPVTHMQTLRASVLQSPGAPTHYCFCCCCATRNGVAPGWRAAQHHAQDVSACRRPARVPSGARRARQAAALNSSIIYTRLVKFRRALKAEISEFFPKIFLRPLEAPPAAPPGGGPGAAARAAAGLA